MCKKVLIVDDDVNFTMNVLNNYLVSVNCSVSIADSLDIANDMLSHGLYDMVLASCKVPGGDSYSLKSKIKKTSPDAKVVFMSSFETEGDFLKSKGENFIYKYNIEQSIERYF